MLNEPNADELNVDVANSGSSGGGTGGTGGTGGGGGGGGVTAPTGAAAGERPSDATLYLTQQDRDAIERVRHPTINSGLSSHQVLEWILIWNIYFLLQLAQRLRIPRAFGVASLLCVWKEWEFSRQFFVIVKFGWLTNSRCK